MNKQNLLIFNFKPLYEILKELEENSNFKIFEASDNKVLANLTNNFQSYLIITKKNLNGFNNQFILNNFPIKFSKLIEKFNIQFLKVQYNKKSKLIIGKYQIDLNSRLLVANNIFLKLTEKEINTIIYLHEFKDAVSIEELQSKVWGYHLKLETHTVETHIYRLRKKILTTFGDNSFIVSQKNGYQIS